MPSSLSYDIDTATAESDDFARLRLALTRLYWEPIGASAWRYPRLDRQHLPEDLMNHVFPICTVFRKLCIDRGIDVTSFSVDVHSRSDWRGGVAPIGTPILPASKIPMCQPSLSSSSEAKLSERKLRTLLAH